MKTKSNLTIYIVVILLFLVNNKTFSQTLCPGDYIVWINSSVTTDMGVYGPEGSVSFKHGNSSGNLQIVVDWNTFQNQSDFVPNSALKKILEHEAVESIVPQVNFPYECDISVYFTSLCYAQVKVVLNLDKTTQVMCCDPNVSNEPDIYTKWDNGELFYLKNVYMTVPCGEKCCKRVYHCERVYNAVTEQWGTTVELTSTETVYSCSSTAELIDCITNEPIPCNESECGW